MTDAQLISALLAIASDPAKFAAAQEIAKEKLFRYDGEIYPRDGCAITLSILLQKAGIGIADIYLAKTIGNILKKRKWKVIPVGEQKAGDVGSTCGPKPGKNDHVYLVLDALGKDKMLIADNQVP